MVFQWHSCLQCYHKIVIIPVKLANNFPSYGEIWKTLLLLALLLKKKGKYLFPPFLLETHDKCLSGNPSACLTSALVPLKEHDFASTFTLTLVSSLWWVNITPPPPHPLPSAAAFAHSHLFTSKTWCWSFYCCVFMRALSSRPLQKWCPGTVFTSTFSVLYVLQVFLLVGLGRGISLVAV